MVLTYICVSWQAALLGAAPQRSWAERRFFSLLPGSDWPSVPIERPGLERRAARRVSGGRVDTDSAEQTPGALGSRLTCPDSCDRVLKNVAYPSPPPQGRQQAGDLQPDTHVSPSAPWYLVLPSSGCSLVRSPASPRPCDPSSITPGPEGAPSLCSWHLEVGWQLLRLAFGALHVLVSMDRPCVSLPSPALAGTRPHRPLQSPHPQLASDWTLSGPPGPFLLCFNLQPCGSPGSLY